MNRRRQRRSGASLPLTAGLSALLVAVVAVAGGLMLRSENSQRKAAVQAVDARRVTAAKFVEAYVAEVFQRERTLANRRLSGPVDAATFDAVIRDHGFAAAVMLDDQGRVVASQPADPAVMGVDVRGRYAHLRSAIGGTPAVSGVVPSVARQEPVIGFAVPFATSQGVRVFSGAYRVQDTPLASFVRNAAPFRTGEVLFVDAAGSIVAASGDGAGRELVAHHPQLAGGAVGSRFVLRGDKEQYVSQGPVAGTSWRVIYSVDTAEMYAPLHGPDRVVRWLTLLGLAVTGMYALMALSRQLRTSDAVARSEALRRAVLDTANDAYIAMDADGTILDWNAAAEGLMGWSAAEAVGTRLSERMIPPERRADHELALGRFLLSGRPVLPDGPVPLRALRRDGTEVSVEMSLSRMRWGATWRFHAFLRDVTARLQQQAELERTEELFRRAFDDAIVGMSITTPQGVVVRVNDTFAGMLGYAREELVGVSFVEITHPDDVGRNFEVMRELMAGERDGFRLTKRYLHRDGSLVHAELSTTLLRDLDGAPLYCSTQIIDITERHDALLERDTHLGMLRSVLANSQSLIYVKDLDGRYLLANEPFERAFGVTEAELLGKDDSYLDPVLAPVWRVNDLLAQAGEHHVEEWSDGPHGRQYYESVKLPLHDGAGKLYAVCGISLDVTESRRAAAALTEARDAALAATAAKSAFLATMSHEIRTPMNAVIGLTGLLLDSELSDQQRDLLDTVRNSGEALLTIINDILDFSKIEAGELALEQQPFSLRECVESAVALVALPAHTKHLELVADIDPDCPDLLVGDVTRIRQVIVNLLSNAVKFTSVGEVVVTVSADPGQPAAGMPPAGTARLRVSVQDTGIGIPADRTDALFRSFSQVDSSTTREYGGTGLGLVISRRLAEAMGGDLQVTSEPGVGSTFVLSVELDLAPDLRRAAPNGPDCLTGRSVLVVDDNATSRRVLSQHLRRWGMTVTVCSSATDALELVAGSPAFDVAVLDAQMPGMDGPALAAALRDRPAGKDLPLLLLSHLHATLQEGDDAAFSAVLTKPVRAAALADALAAVVGSVEHGLRRVETAGGRRAGDGPAVRAPQALRVLLAEDNLVNQKVAQLMLGQLGHHVDTVGNGLEALDAVHRLHYDVVLMDVQMPVLDGLAATARLRAELPSERQPYILALTASALAEDRAACMAAGVDAFLSKPVRQRELGAALHQVRPNEPRVWTPPPAPMGAGT